MRMEEQKETEYLLASQIAEIIGEKWSRQRVHVELKRGKFPNPDKYVSNQPMWMRETVEWFIKGKGMA